MENDNVPVAKVLLEAGAGPSVQDNEKLTPLHYATRIGSLPAVELLVEYRAELDIADVRG